MFLCRYLWLSSSYVRKPYLIRGRKFDIRLYVLVTGFNPLRVYVFDDGLVRFATQKYVTLYMFLSSDPFVFSAVSLYIF